MINAHTDKLAIYQAVRENENFYLLLDTALLEAKAYQPLASDAVEFTPAPSINKLIAKVDKFTIKEWLWEETIWDKYAETGPILVEVEAKSPLLEHFCDHWAKQNGGVILTSEYKIKQLHQQLRSLITIPTANGGTAAFNLHRPQRLSTVFAVLDEQQSAAMLGPIETIIWNENCGPESQWYQVNNPQVHPPKHIETAWFTFNPDQVAKMNSLSGAWYKHSLYNTIHADIQNKTVNGHSLQHLETCSETDLQALIDAGMEHSRELGIRDQTLMQQYIQMTLYYPEQLGQTIAGELLADQSIHPNLRLKTAKQAINNHPNGAAP